MEQITRSIEHISVCDVAGPRDAFPIVLVHGVSWTRKMWMPQLEALSDEFRVIALDLPGHGARMAGFRSSIKRAICAIWNSPKRLLSMCGPSRNSSVEQAGDEA